MGLDDGEKDEGPAHVVHLDGFYVDKLEVTNAQYLAFLRSRPAARELPDSLLVALSDSDLQIRWTGQQYELKSITVSQRPVVEVTWQGARAYCEWSGGRLPTEAEWEKAARGTDGRSYPWGGGISRERANYKGLFSQPIEVGHYAGGASPYGALDMAGNVWEWVSDWYDSSYYSRSPERGPQGPANGSFRTIKGGSWGTEGAYLRSSYRYGIAPDWSDDSIGFRCARDL
jgi:formylglycine-generating enzyme required for sulfatase activity